MAGLQIPATITDKLTMRDMFYRNIFGNRLRAWTVEDFLTSGWELSATLGYNGVPGIAPPYYGESQPASEIYLLALRWERECGLDMRRMVVWENDDRQTRVFQGEVMRSEHYYDLTFTNADAPMRVAFRQHREYARGLQAALLMRRYMDAPSWDNLQELFDLYPSAVVEFSCYGESVGHLGRNTVFWEVREY
jgi:hypothetical protein